MRLSQKFPKLHVGFLTLSLLLMPYLCWAPPMKTDHIKEADSLSEQEALRFLYNLRLNTFSESYVLRFKLKHYPPRDRVKVYYGSLYGSIDPLTGVNRERLIVEQRSGESPSGFETLKEALIERGAMPLVWIKDNEQVKLLDREALEEPIIPETTLSFMDFLTPFLYWNQYEYLGPSRIKARPTQTYRMYAPFDSETTALIELDDEFAAILKAEVSQGDASPAKSLELISFKKTSGKYIPKIIDYLDHENHGNKTRIEVTAAALDVELPESLFDETLLAGEFPKFDPLVFDVF
jgi:hypothetical protein